MMRIGPWMLAAGLALLGAGIVSSASEAWKREKQERSVALDMTGVEALDVGRTRIDRIVLAPRGDAMLEYSMWDGSRPDDDKPVVGATRERDVLKIDGALDYGVALDVALTLPVTSVRRLSGRKLAVQAESNAHSLRLEGSDVSWKGDADVLDVRLVASWESGCMGKQSRNASGFVFEAGRVGVLRISSEGGTVKLGDLSRVDKIELHAGDDVRMDVRRVSDLRRIQFLPFDGVPAQPPRDEGGERQGDAAAWAAYEAAACASMM